MNKFKEMVLTVPQRFFILSALLATLFLQACSEDVETSAPQTPPAQAETQSIDSVAAEEEQVLPAITRFKMGTIGAPDLAAMEEAYAIGLGYQVIERGQVSEALAKSWGTPNMAGRDYIIMQPESGVDVFIRAVQITAQPDYKPMSTFGWNAFEIIVDDIYAVHERLKNSPFEVIGEPASLGGTIASIYVMQAEGPAGEILYFNSETGDRSKSRLPIPGSLVDRLNIAILAGADSAAMSQFYTEALGMQSAGAYDMPVGILAQALGLPEEYVFRLEMVTALEGGNLLEIDDYPDDAGQRARADGELPPGNAMISFIAKDLNTFKADFVQAPVPLEGVAYGGKKSATIVGLAGELIEVIEE